MTAWLLWNLRQESAAALGRNRTGVSRDVTIATATVSPLFSASASSCEREAFISRTQWAGARTEPEAEAKWLTANLSLNTRYITFISTSSPPSCMEKESSRRFSFFEKKSKSAKNDVLRPLPIHPEPQSGPSSPLSSTTVVKSEAGLSPSNSEYHPPAGISLSP